MKRFDIDENYWADCVVESRIVAGEIYHIARNSSGGSNSTPIARYFAWHPAYSEGFNEHWRIDCFVKRHKLSPKQMSLGKALVAALLKEKLCAEPLWLSVHSSEELEGEAYGEVFEKD